MTVLANRIRNLPPYLFARLEQLKQEVLDRGVDLIDLSIGDPDVPTFPHIVEAMKQALKNPANHRYPSSAGMPRFREAVARWYRRRFHVTVEPKGQVLSLIGSKEGIGHLPFAFVDPGDVVLVPDPGYPVYAIGTLLAGGESHSMPLMEEHGFLPDLESIPADILGRARIMWLNYPNNPTAAVAGRDFFEKAVAMAKEYDFIICHDAAYSEMYFEGEKPMSFLEVPGALDVGVEIHSLSKTYNMTGWRVGYAAGNAEIIGGLQKVKSNLDSGVFQAIQEAAMVALETGEDVLDELRGMYQQRRDALYEGLREAGLRVAKPRATFYLWARVPDGFDSAGYAEHLLERAGILATPGSGFGDPGEGFIRFALTVDVQRTREAAERIKKSL
jgi:LL-diaminopimelate aminotransferase